MKKLLTGAVAVLALLFGFASCSGDLHDASEISLKGGACPGAMNGWSNKSVWTTEVGNVYTYDFTATSTEAEWKCIAKSGDWNSGAFGGGKNDVIETPAGKTTLLTYDDATGGYKNAKITGMEIGSEYRITVTVNVLEASAKVECIKPVPKFNILIKGDDGKYSTKEMTPTTGGYSYLVKSSTAGSINFQICGANMVYYSEGAEVTVGFSETETAEFEIAEKDTTFKYAAGEYLIFVGVENDKFDAVNLKVKYAALLKSAYFAINGPMGITPLTENEDGSYSVEFKGSNKGWGAGDGDMCFTLYGQSTEEKMKDNNNWWSGTLYRFGGFDCKLGEKTTCKADGDNITLKGISDNVDYKATFTSDAESIYMTVTAK